MNDTDKDLEQLLADVRRAAAQFGAKPIRAMVLAFAGWADVETASITTRATGGSTALTADELAYATKHKLDVAQMAKAKAAAIADGSYPGLAG